MGCAWDLPPWVSRLWVQRGLALVVVVVAGLLVWEAGELPGARNAAFLAHNQTESEIFVLLSNLGAHCAHPDTAANCARMTRSASAQVAASIQDLEFRLRVLESSLEACRSHSSSLEAALASVVAATDRERESHREERLRLEARLASEVAASETALRRSKGECLPCEQGCPDRSRSSAPDSLCEGSLALMRSRSALGPAGTAAPHNGSCSALSVAVREYLLPRPEVLLPRSRRVISYSLFAKKESAAFRYFGGVAARPQEAALVYPGWELRLYLDRSLSPHVYAWARSLGWNAIPVETNPIAWVSMASRMLVADDPAVELFLQRDLDSILSQRDRLSTDEWLASGAAVVSVRDHKYHVQPLLGGMWGAKVWELRQILGTSLADLQQEAAKSELANDQVFLERFLWPRVKRFAYVIDTYGNRCKDPEARCHKLPNDNTTQKATDVAITGNHHMGTFAFSHAKLWPMTERCSCAVVRTNCSSVTHTFRNVSILLDERDAGFREAVRLLADACADSGSISG